MKRQSLLLLTLLFATIGLAQQKDETIYSQSIPVTFHGETGRLDQFQESPGTINEITKEEKIGYHPKNDWILNPTVNPNALPQGPDPALQQDYAPPAPPTKAATQDWAGIGYTNVNPADPSVDVGPNHVVQMINGSSGAYIRIYTKTGTVLVSQTYFDNFMGMPGGAGDPIVLYDERANRWLLSEFSASGNNMHVAISTTPDPGGTYYTYSFNAPTFPDYPKYSIWENEYVITTNETQSTIYALNRTNLLAGTATPAQRFTMTNFGTIGFQAATPVSMNGTAVPPGNTPALLMRMRDDAWSGAATDALEMWELDIDWANSANSTLIQVQTLGISPHESELCGYTSFSCIPQPGTGTQLDPLRELLMNRIHYRNFGTHESIVCCHVTDVNGADRAGIRWYELRRTGGTAGTWSIYQQSTYSPDANGRFMPTIGISATGNIGLAYCVSSSSTYPSMRYTGRKSCDPLNTMTEPETAIIGATGTASNASNRWGDYFAMGLDPSDGQTFFFTGAYNTSSQWSTRVAAFNLGSCSPTVSFAAATATENEAGANQANGCLPYSILTIPISIAADPSQPAGITVNVSGGTATQGEDYTVQTNSFTLDGPTLTGTVEIWVYDDDYIEGNETIILNYTLNANGGNAVAGSTNQTVTVTINDDDLAPGSVVVSSIIFQDDFQDGTLAPFSTLNPSGATAFQVGNLGTASSTAYAIPTSNTGQFAWVNDDACNCNQNQVDLVLPSLDLTGYTTANFSFLSYFEDNTYQGNNENADVFISVNGAPDVLVGTLVASPIDVSWTTQNFNLTPYVGNANVVLKVRYSDAGGWLYGCAIDDVVVSGTSPIGVQTAINTGMGHTANLGPNKTVHFYDPTSGNVMMTLENTSAFDYGCVTVEVDRSGTTAAQFNTTAPSDYLASKTYTVVPSASNPSGSYTMTLYYEEAEVAGWEAATGNSRTNAEIVKVDGSNAINDVTPGNAASYTISSAASTLGTFGSDVTFTASFSTGFSGFGLGIYNPAVGTPPVANFSASPTTLCAGGTVNFTDLSSNTPTAWAWDFGDGGTSNLQNPSHVYATAGTYSVSLTASNGSGSDPVTLTNYITVNPIPTVTASGTATICAGNTATISGAGATTYSWDNGLGSGATQNVSPTSTTTYTVIGTTAGCSNTAQVTITVTPLPTLTAAGTATLCAGQSTTITGSGATTYSWDNGLGAGATQNVTPASTTTYTVTGTTSGCSNTAQVTITVNPNPVISVASFTDPSSCASATGDITVGGSGTGDVSWTGPTPGNAVGISLPYSLTMLNSGTYSITFVDVNGCTSNQVSQNLTDPNAPTVTSTGTTALCEGESTVISASGATTYSWDNGLGAGATQTVTPLVTTTYTVTGTTAGCTNTSQVTITVLPTVTHNQSASICEGSSYTVGTSIYTASGTYTDVLSASNGCDSTVVTNLTVNPLPVVTVAPDSLGTVCIATSGIISMVGTPAGGTFSGPGVSGNSFDPTVAGLGTHTLIYSYTDGNGCNASTLVGVLVEDCNIGIGENMLDGVVLSPNPNDGVFVVTGLDLGSAYLIYDEKGRLIESGTIEKTAQEIRMLQAETGMYYLHATANGTTGIVKFLITGSK